MANEFISYDEAADRLRKARGLDSDDAEYIREWFNKRGFSEGPFSRTKFEYELIKHCPHVANRPLQEPWSPPEQLTANILDALPDKFVFWLSDAVNLMAFGQEEAPEDRHPLEIVARRRQAATALFEAASAGSVTLIGIDKDGDRNDRTIPPRYFDLPRNLDDPDNSIYIDLANLPSEQDDALWYEARHGEHQKWFHGRVERRGFVAWLRARVLGDGFSYLSDLEPKQKIGCTRVASPQGQISRRTHSKAVFR